MLRQRVGQLDLLPVGPLLLRQPQPDSRLPLLDVEEAEGEHDLRQPHAEDGADDEEAEAVPQPRDHADGGHAAQQHGGAEGDRRRARVHGAGSAAEGEDGRGVGEEDVDA